MQEKITGIVLAGGKSTRMGKNKAAMQYGGKMLIEYSIHLLRRMCDELIISANGEQYPSFGYPVIPDKYEHIGPMGGIEAALAYSKTRHNLIIPADTPFLTSGLYYRLLKNSKGNLAVVPYSGKDKLEPLIAYYSKEMLPEIQKQINDGNYKMHDLIQRTGYRGIELADPTILRNLNTGRDMEKADRSGKMILDNLILVSGDGRNVGKTSLACEIIRHLSRHTDVIALKISPHVHEIASEHDLVYKNEGITVIRDKARNAKDSSRMLQAGAKMALFAMVEQDHYQELISALSSRIKDQVVVCESGGLAEVVQPGLFLYVRKEGSPIAKMPYMDQMPIPVTKQEKGFDLHPEQIGYVDHGVTFSAIRILN